jgi:hypothetical protein
MAHREEPGEVDISRGEAGEHELNRLIEKRHDQRIANEEQRRIEDGWVKSTARYDAERRRELRAAWVAFHENQAARHRTVLGALITHHQAEAQKYKDQPKGDSA